jgi:hypothetical protein
MTLPMRSILRYLPPLFLLLMLAGGVQARQGDGSAVLAEKERALQARIVLQQQRQQFLLFEKALSAADSKYLLLDLRAGRGTLRYRNRVLRTFSLTVRPPGAARRLSPGPVRLSAKIDGKPPSRELVFAEPAAVIMAAKAGAGASKGRHVPRILLGTRDLASVFHALETGSYLYIVPEGDHDGR